MARSYLLSDLVEDVRTRYDLPVFSADTFVNQTAVERFIQESLQDLYAILTETYGSDYFLTTATIAATQNIATTALPSGAGKIRRLYWYRGVDDVPEIHKGKPDDLKLSFYSARSWDDGVRYYLTGRNITWLPTPNQTYSVRILYSATQANIDSSSNPWSAEAGWADYVIEDVCRKIAEREEKDPSLWIACREEWARRIRSQAPEREDGEADAIRDTWGGAEKLSAYELRNRLTLGDY